MFDRLQVGLMHTNPARTVESLRQRLYQLSTQCERTITGKVDGLKQEFAGTTARLEVLSPLKTLSRGYTIATTATGAVVTNAGQLTTGDRLKLHLYHGNAFCRVEELEKP
jgi:exodeoxyribonuclease VII large subunit